MFFKVLNKNSLHRCFLTRRLITSTSFPQLNNNHRTIYIFIQQLNKNTKNSSINTKIFTRKYVVEEPRISAKPEPNKKELEFWGWNGFFTLVIFGAAVVYFLYGLKEEKKEETVKKSRHLLIGKIGNQGPIDLVDQNGKKYKSTDFLGNWLLMYFGFTHPNTKYPQELRKLVETTENIEKQNHHHLKLLPLFVTFDPEKDNVDSLGKYLEEFSAKKLVGLRADKKQIEEFLNALKHASGDKDDPKNFLAEHTMAIYLVNPEGELVEYFEEVETSSDIARKTSQQIKQYEKEKATV